MLTGPDYDAFVEDIKTHGLLDPLTLTPDGLLLDGKVRLKICEQLKIEAKTVVYDGDPVAYTISKNQARRHLSPVEKAFVAARLSKLPHGGDRGNQHTGGKRPSGRLPLDQQKQDNIADMLKTPPRTLRRAKAVLDKGTPEVIKLVEEGKVSLNAGDAYVQNTPKEEQQADPEVIKQATRKNTNSGGTTSKAKPEPKAKPETDDEKMSKRSGGPQLARAREIVRPLLMAGKSISPHKLEEAHGISHVTFDMAITAELGYQEGYQAGFDAALTPESLGPTLKARYERLVKRQEKEFKKRVDEQVQEFVRSTMWQSVRERLRFADAVVNREPPLTREEYRKILMALHTDTSNPQLLNEGLTILNKKKDILRPAAEKSEGLLAGLQERLDETLGRRETRH